MVRPIVAGLLMLSCIGLNVSAETFGGVGLTVAQIFNPEVPSKEGEIVVLGVIPGTDAEKNGILPGDVITAIDGKNTSGRHFEDLIMNSLRGTAGSTATMQIRRFGKKDLLTITIERVLITPPPEK